MKNIFGALPFLFIYVPLFAQQKNYTVEITPFPALQKIVVTINHQPFTEFIYPDSLPKPVLFPIYAPDGQLITRGFPLATRADEPTDHPHHYGLWLNYENVNGLDFWNNSSAIPAEKKHLYGSIRTTGIQQTKSGAKGFLTYTANWTDQQKKPLLEETTTFVFSADKDARIIDRTTVLTAVQDISFEDVKDGFLGLRIAHELELPSAQPKTFTDDKGNVTNVAPDTVASGNYLTSTGKEGDSAWGTRAVWCLLYGKKNSDSISIAIIDHPGNPGYPTYWHARGYGLFAANPLGQKIFSNGKESLNFKLVKGKSVTFRYRIVIASGKDRLPVKKINEWADGWAKEQ
jgi:Methane oxygenase PmoA